MRILVHDHCGHPFQVQLSRELARRGHDVLHAHCVNFTTGKGSLERLDDDPPDLRIEGIDLGEPFAKYSFFKRMGQERRYGALLVERAARFAPEVVLSGNTPLLSQAAIAAWCNARGIRGIHWLQDVISAAMRRAARGRLPVLGGALGSSFALLERRVVRRADAVVAISDDFRPVLTRWGVPADVIHVIPNWAPLDELPERPRSNAWSEQHGPSDRFVFLYAGTLGIKHNPELLLQLAMHHPDARVIVISEGRGADWLTRRIRERSIDNLELLPFQPWHAMPDVLATADVLVAILEPEAGAFSVPSKVLSYHCAARPILAAIPRENLAARIITDAGSGLVTDPHDTDAFVAAATHLATDDELRSGSARQARAYAERTFDIDRITTAFEAVLATPPCE